MATHAAPGEAGAVPARPPPHDAPSVDAHAASPPPLAEEAAVVGLESAPLSGERTSSTATATPTEPRKVGGSRDFGFLPIPRRLQYDSARPFHFGLLLNVIFAFAATFSVANLYYPQPILIVLSDNFGVSYQKVTNIPTLLQASYALGLAFICPLGDLVRRRPLLLLVVAIAAILSLILAVVPNVTSFQAISFFLGAASVTPQILLPLAGDLAPPARRASALSIVLAGLLLGILLARVLAGLIAEKASVSALYYMSFGLQALIWVLVYATVPDYPAKNAHLSYFEILWSMAKYLVTEPVLVQGCLISGAASIIFSCFWTSSTFLLGDIYGYNSLEIGLFALVGVAGILAAPFLGRLIDGLVPWLGTLIGIVGILVSQSIFTGAAASSIGAVVVVIFVLDLAMQMQQVSNSTRIFALSSAARARLSAVYLVCVFAGQLIGTAAGTRIYLDAGGYRASGGFCVAVAGFMLVVLSLRGPHLPDKRWVGWAGGWELRKAVHERQVAEKEEAAALDGPGAAAIEGDEGKKVELMER
ncbi:uncharacterized protein RHOBADRAFT_48544 [Rhodotorula graminis WP1]|uniref:Major facilitator superfamily (MFS) profile domain-containing protein n=1 Tax=Rhodotorula graminis (strain WP1) TaxID=578459 RepID=A0A194S392_RHOGW|nr:uncharacterized protein RHOBADRAFT_48544 [Rhodotorula graminis WP1]KPV74970.1 hypothetical protein RHOBADRAFT_48544 [Rhodotorula graminis WP1]